MNFDNFLKVESDRFVYRGKDVLLRSVGLGNWLNLEHFMLGIPGTQQQIHQVFNSAFGAAQTRTFWEDFYNIYIDKADIDYIAASGFNSIRIPINHHLFHDTPVFADSTAIRQTDRVLQLCEQAGLWAILDLHTAPGGQNPDWHSDNASGDALFWKEDHLNEVASLWGKIANYYKDSPVVAGYDLLNEPCYLDNEFDDALFTFHVRATNEIRKVDANHIVFYEGNTYSRDFTMYPYTPDENGAYTFHYYPFLQLVEQPVAKEGFPARIEAQLKQDVSMDYLKNRLKKPLWCGETGHPHHAPDTAYMTTEFIHLLEQQNISWALWPYKDAGSMGRVTLHKDGGWNTKMRALSGEWRFFDFFQQDSALAVSLEENKLDYYTRLAAFSTKGLERFEANLSHTSIDELHSLLLDFKFENCKKYD